jgi:hypothetical protein
VNGANGIASRENYYECCYHDIKVLWLVYCVFDWLQINCYLFIGLAYMYTFYDEYYVINSLIMITYNDDYWTISTKGYLWGSVQDRSHQERLIAWL